jgi:hypothetical protein
MRARGKRRAAASVAWTEQESAIAEKHARLLASGRHVNAAAAGEACLLELQRRCRSRLALRSVLGRIRGRARRLARDVLSIRWLPEERQIAMKHVRRFHALRRKMPRWEVRDSARELMVELYTRGYDRSLMACSMEIWKHRRGRFKHRDPVLIDPPAPAR